MSYPAANTCRLGILISGRGSNMRAIAEAIAAGTLPGAKIALVASNVPSAPGLADAAALGLATAVIPRQDFARKSDYDAALRNALQTAGVELVILAGYDRIVGPALLDAYAGRMLNIHPSLLPRFGGRGMVGLAVHAAVLDAGETESGCTVHGVSAEVDAGPIVDQATVPVLPEDTPETLAARVLAAEHRLFPRAIARFIEAHPLPVADLSEDNAHAPV